MLPSFVPYEVPIHIREVLAREVVAQQIFVMHRHGLWLHFGEVSRSDYLQRGCRASRPTARDGPTELGKDAQEDSAATELEKMAR